MNKEEVLWWLLLIKAIATVHNIQESVLSLVHCQGTMKLNKCLGFGIWKFHSMYH